MPDTLSLDELRAAPEPKSTLSLDELRAAPDTPSDTEIPPTQADWDAITDEASVAAFAKRFPKHYEGIGKALGAWGEVGHAGVSMGANTGGAVLAGVTGSGDDGRDRADHAKIEQLVEAGVPRDQAVSRVFEEGAGYPGRLIGPMREAAQSGREAKGTADAVGTTLLNTAGATLALGPNTVIQALPQSWRETIAVPFEKLDEHIAKPLADKTGLQSVRALVNVGVPTAVGVGAAKGLKGARGAWTEAAANRVPLAEPSLPEIPTGRSRMVPGPGPVEPLPSAPPELRGSSATTGAPEAVAPTQAKLFRAETPSPESVVAEVRGVTARAARAAVEKARAEAEIRAESAGGRVVERTEGYGERPDRIVFDIVKEPYASSTVEPAAPASPSVTARPAASAQPAAPTGLAARVQKAGFASIEEAVDALRRGDETSMRMLRDADAQAIRDLADQPRRARYMPAPDSEINPTPHAPSSTSGTGATETPPLRPVRPADASSSGTGYPGTEPLRGADAPPRVVEPAQSSAPPMRRFATRGQRGSVGDVPGGVSLDRAETVAGRAAEGLAERAGGAGATASRWLGTYLDSLKSFGEPGQQLRDLVSDVIVRRDKLSGTYARELQQAIDRVPRGQREWLDKNLRAVQEGRAQAQTPEQQAFVDWWRTKHPELARTFNERGVRILDEGGPRPIREDFAEFFPQQPRPEILEKIRAGDPETIARFNREFVGADKPFDTPEAAKQFLEQYHEPGLKSYHAGTERARRFHWPDEWVEPSGFKSLRTYGERGIANAVEHEVFGYRDPKTGAPINPDASGNPQGKLGDLLAKITPTDAAVARDTTLRILRRNPSDMSSAGKGVRNFNALEGAFSAARLYIKPTTWLQQASQAPMLLAQVGEIPFAKALRDVFAHPRRVYDRGIREGAFRPMSEYTSTIGFENDPIGATAEAASKWNNRLLTPLSASDTAQRMVAFAAADHWAPRLMENLNGTARAARAAETALRKMDFTPEEIARFKQRAPSDVDMTKLRQSLVRVTQGEATAAERLPAAAVPAAHVLFRGKNFGISQARNTWRVVGAQLREGNPLPALRLLAAAYVVGEALKGAKDTITGPSLSRPRLEDAKDGMDVARSIASTMHEAAVGGWAGDAVASAIPRKDGRVNVRNFLSNTVMPQSADFLIDGADNSVKVLRAKHGKRVDAWLDLLRDAAPDVAEWERIFDMASPRGINRRLRETTRKSDGAARVGYGDYNRQLRERRRALLEAGGK